MTQAALLLSFAMVLAASGAAGCLSSQPADALVSDAELAELPSPVRNVTLLDIESGSLRQVTTPSSSSSPAFVNESSLMVTGRLNRSAPLSIFQIALDGEEARPVASGHTPRSVGSDVFWLHHPPDRPEPTEIRVQPLEAPSGSHRVVHTIDDCTVHIQESLAVRTDGAWAVVAASCSSDVADLPTTERLRLVNVSSGQASELTTGSYPSYDDRGRVWSIDRFSGGNTIGWIDPGTGEEATVVEGQDGIELTYPVVVGEGATLVYMARDISADVYELRARDLATGEERVLIRGERFSLGPFDVSEDGSLFAFRILRDDG